MTNLLAGNQFGMNIIGVCKEVLTSFGVCWFLSGQILKDHPVLVRMLLGAIMFPGGADDMLYAASRTLVVFNGLTMVNCGN